MAAYTEHVHIGQVNFPHDLLHVLYITRASRPKFLFQWNLVCYRALNSVNAKPQLQL